MATTSNAYSTHNEAEKKQKHIFIVTGPAGCGKTSVAERLQARFGFVYLEGDDFHTESNISKMANNQPLSDSDRWDWLIRLRDEALAVLHGDRTSSSSYPSESSTLNTTSAPASSMSSPQPQASPSSSTSVLLTCSALKRKYRDVLRVASVNDPSVSVHFLFLSVSKEKLLQRVRARKGHYMKESMVRSQLASLETPAVASGSSSESEGEGHSGDEERDVAVVDAGKTPEEVAAEAERAVLGILAANP